MLYCSMKDKVSDGFFDEGTKERALEMYAGYCKVCEKQATEFHHALVHNTKYNRSKYPTLVKSLINCFPLCHRCHTKFQHRWDITDLEAKQLEEWLNEK